jgi:hypothetical protein
MTDSEKIDLLTREVAVLKKAAHDQAVDSFKIMSLLRLVISNAGYESARIEEMMVSDHETATRVVGKKLGFSSAQKE